MIVFVVIGLAIVALIVAAMSIKIVKRYERVVQFRLGKVLDGPRGPGIIFIIPLVDRARRVSLRIVMLPIQSQGIITKDNVSVGVSAVAYYRVTDPIASIVAIEDAGKAIDQIAQTTLRAVVGRHTLDEALSETETITQNIREILDVQTEEWGVEVTVVELKDIQLPDSMQRAMARQAEAEREKRAKVIAAQGESLAAGELAAASDVMMARPARPAATQPADADRARRRQELDRRLPGAADEHDPGARGLPRPRGKGGRGRPDRAADPRDPERDRVIDEHRRGRLGRCCAARRGSGRPRYRFPADRVEPAAPQGAHPRAA
jgi:regulator of protease activity HflC (stomatin/prohibitin superfamily)